MEEAVVKLVDPTVKSAALANVRAPKLAQLDGLTIDYSRTASSTRT